MVAYENGLQLTRQQFNYIPPFIIEIALCIWWYDKLLLSRRLIKMLPEHTLNPNVSPVLHNWFHCPLHYKKNHINLGKFTKDNAVYFEFHPNHYLVKSSILGFKWSVDVILYEFPSRQRQPLSLSNSVSSVFPIGNTLLLLTMYLNMLILVSSHGISGLDIPNTLSFRNVIYRFQKILLNSSACCVGKLHRSPSSLLQVFDEPVFYP